MDVKSYLNLYPKAFDYCEKKMRKKIFENLQTFLLLFYTEQREDAHRYATIKK